MGKSYKREKSWDGEISDSKESQIKRKQPKRKTEKEIVDMMIEQGLLL